MLIANNKSNSDIFAKQNCLIAAIADILFKISRAGTGNLILVVPSRVSGQNEAIPLDACEQMIFSPSSV